MIYSYNSNSNGEMFKVPSNTQEKYVNQLQLAIRYLVSLLKEAVRYYGIKNCKADPFGRRVHKAIYSYKDLETIKENKMYKTSLKNVDGKKVGEFTDEQMKELDLAIKIASKRGQLKTKISDDGTKLEVSMPLPNIGIVKK